MNGTAGEYVYDPSNGQKVSYLDWQIKKIPVAILGLSHRFDNNLELGVSFKKNFKHMSSGRMRDYDWYSPEANNEDPDGNEVDPKYYGNLSNFSDNTNRLNKLLSIDTNVKYWFEHSENFKSAPMIGFRYDEFKFHGNGGVQ